MSRIFLSHAQVDAREAIALKSWLSEQRPQLANEIFLDIDPDGLQLGTQWKSELFRQNSRCEVVICLVSEAWSASHECKTEYRTAENLGKQIIVARLADAGDTDITAEWQRCDLFADGSKVQIDVAGQGLVTFNAAALDRLRKAIEGTGIGPENFVWPPAEEPDRSPYRGWQPFETMDAGVFFGRDAAIIQGLDVLRSMRLSGSRAFFVVLGPSGSGKSSFLRAGLLPRLQREDRRFHVLGVVRPERDALTGQQGLATAIHQGWRALQRRGSRLGDIKQACQEHDAEQIAAILNRLRDIAAARLPEDDREAGAPTLVLPLDQAEELFAPESASHGARFLQLVAAVQQRMNTVDIGLIIAATIRTDRFEIMQNDPALHDATTVLFDKLKPMPETQFREVISGPAARTGDSEQRVRFAPDLVDRLLEDATADSTTGGDTLPLLSLVLARLYTDWMEGSAEELTVADYEAMGGLANVVNEEVGELLSTDSELREQQLKELRAAFIPHLATVKTDSEIPLRRVARWSDIPESSYPMLDRMVDKRLMVKSIRDGETVVEVALESLLRQWDELDGWLRDERQNLITADNIQQSAKAWRDHGEDPSYLLNGSRLSDAEKLLSREDFVTVLTDVGDYVAVSRRDEDDRLKRIAAEERRRRTRVVRAVFAAAVVVGLVAAALGVGLWNSQKMRVALQLVTRSEQMLDGGLAGGDVLALQQLLVARSLGASNADGVVNRRTDLLKIMENPLNEDGVPVPVFAVAVSPDGSSRLAAANEDKTVRVWDTETAAVVHELPVGAVVRSVVYSPDGQWIVTGDDDGVTQLWNAESGERQGDSLVGRSGVTSVAFSPDGQLIAIGDRDGTLRVWDLERSRWLMQVPVLQTGAVRAVAFQPALATLGASSATGEPTGPILLTADDDYKLRLWNARTGEPVGPARRIDSAPISVAFGRAVGAESEAFSRIAVGDLEGAIQVFDGQTLDPLSRRMPAHPGSVNSVAFSAGGSRIISGGTDNSIRVWGVDIGGDSRDITVAPIGTPLLGHHGSVNSVAFNQDSTRIISGGRDGSVRAWDAVTALPIPAQQGTGVRAVAFRPTGAESPDAQMASGGFDGTVMLWDPSTAAAVGRLGIPVANGAEAINALAYSPDGSRIVTGGNNGLQLWDLTRLSRLPSAVAPDRSVLPRQRVMAVAFSPDGSKIVAGDRDGGVRLLDGHTLAPLAQQELPYQIWSVTFLDDGHIVTGSGLDSTLTGSSVVQRWTVDPLEPDGQPWEGPSLVYALASHPSSNRLAAGGLDGVIHLLDLAAEGSAGGLLRGDQNTVSSIAFARDQPWIVAGGGDGKVRLWDVERAQPIGVPIDAQQHWVYAVAVSPDDRMIVSAGGDGTLHLWPAPQQNLAEVICPKIGANMSHAQWDEHVSRFIPYREQCPGLPVAE